MILWHNIRRHPVDVVLGVPDFPFKLRSPLSQEQPLVRLARHPVGDQGIHYSVYIPNVCC